MEIKNDLTRLLARFGPTKVMSVWKETVAELRESLRHYEEEQSAIAQPELIYQRQEVQKKPRKTRQKKSDVTETSQ